MAKNGLNLNQNHLILIGIIILILLGFYLLHMQMQYKKKVRESFYQIENFSQLKKLNIEPKMFQKIKLDNDNDTLYIYTTTREKVSCKKAHSAISSGSFPENIAIAGIPPFNLHMYESENGFSKSIGLPTPSKINGKFFDYIMSFLTNKKNIDYYTKDNSKSNMCPITQKPYYYNESFRNKIGIRDKDFIELMREFFRVLIANNNNTSIRFIRYYKKDSIIHNKDKRSYEEIEGHKLEEEIKNKNVIVFIENINIIKFLQVTYPKLYNNFKEYSRALSINFKELA
jgi:hypothetical protein